MRNLFGHVLAFIAFYGVFTLTLVAFWTVWFLLAPIRALFFG
jgi:hypothetical protein